MSCLGWLIVIALITAAAATVLAAWRIRRIDGDEENIGF
jgi:ABC-type lipoprotein release transport system permease subunit